MLSPSWLLALLCCCAALLFGDRGLLSSNAVSGGDARDQSGIRATFDLSIAATGWIYASVMVRSEHTSNYYAPEHSLDTSYIYLHMHWLVQIGLAISAPAAAYYGQRCNALRMVGLGVATSGLGAALTAAAPTFPIMLVGRVVTGMGCGPFISFASPLIEDSAPLENKTTFLALLFLCLPVGFAGGFIWGSAVALAWGWRAAFWTEALIMIMYGVICLCIPRPNDVRKHQSTSDASGSTLKKDLNQLIRSPVVVLAMLALALLNGSIGGFSFYGPKAAKTLYDLQAATADTLFGAITVAMGIVGTLSGGAALDLMGANVRMALIISSVGLGLAAVALSTAFGIAKCLWTFSIGLAIGEGAMFATVGLNFYCHNSRIYPLWSLKRFYLAG